MHSLLLGPFIHDFCGEVARERRTNQKILGYLNPEDELARGAAMHAISLRTLVNRPLRVVGELIPAPMPELMRLHGESQLSALARLGNHLPHAGIGQRSFTLGEKDVRGLTRQAFELP